MLSPIQQKFTLHWGEMASRWGLSRTAAQIEAVLFTTEAPVTAADLAENLGVARSNISVAVRELENWGLCRVVHVLGDRREHFETPKDPWELLRIVAAKRKERELDPAMQSLSECLDGLRPNAKAENYVCERLEQLRSALQSLEELFTIFGKDRGEALAEVGEELRVQRRPLRHPEKRKKR